LRSAQRFRNSRCFLIYSHIAHPASHLSDPRGHVLASFLRYRSYLQVTGGVAGRPQRRRESMSYSKITAALLIAATATLLGVGAYASETPSVSGCLKISKQVKDALETHQQGSTYDAAKAEQKSGNEFCTNGLYKSGIAHYQAALKIVGASASSSLH
jgi:hypothetical protein